MTFRSPGRSSTENVPSIGLFGKCLALKGVVFP